MTSEIEFFNEIESIENAINNLPKQLENIKKMLFYIFKIKGKKTVLLEKIIHLTKNH